MLKIGDRVIAVDYCGFPDNTTKGKEYEIVRVEHFSDRAMFYIIDDNGEERWPISTTFRICNKR